MDKPKKYVTKQKGERQQKLTPVKEEEEKKEVPVKHVPKHPLDRYYNPVTGSRFEALGDLYAD